MSANHENPSKILDYATPDTQEQVPDYSAAAEELLNAGGSPLQLLGVFRRIPTAERYYARHMSRRYAMDCVQDCCVECGSAEDRRIVRVVWRVSIPDSSRHLHLIKGCSGASFAAFYTICPNCYRKWRRRIYNAHSFLICSGSAAAGFFLVGVASVVAGRSAAMASMVTAGAWFGAAGMLCLLGFACQCSILRSTWPSVGQAFQSRLVKYDHDMRLLPWPGSQKERA